MHKYRTYNSPKDRQAKFDETSDKLAAEGFSIVHRDIESRGDYRLLIWKNHRDRIYIVRDNQKLSSIEIISI